MAVVGAGPFGLSVAAHLRKLGVDCCIVGSPMASWKNNMPKGMLLKSAGFASSRTPVPKRMTAPLRRPIASSAKPTRGRSASECWTRWGR
ncbi:FAD-dependent monooxygenase [Bradyrhizobium erythrophlei]|uniref:FAD-dependent monooxygenase n=1 Tax=Bradyrhizobium erythrophlei TaxID=1437360 RepID=UPI0035EF8518